MGEGAVPHILGQQFREVAYRWPQLCSQSCLCCQEGRLRSHPALSGCICPRFSALHWQELEVLYWDSCRWQGARWVLLLLKLLLCCYL